MKPANGGRLYITPFTQPQLSVRILFGGLVRASCAGIFYYILPTPVKRTHDEKFRCDSLFFQTLFRKMWYDMYILIAEDPEISRKGEAMKDILIFKRVEKKYRLTPAQKNALFSEVSAHLTPDAHGRSTICSLYLDTPEHLIIRNSIDAKAYKEKLRLRSYGTPAPEDTVFLELKKKYKGVVYKRRVSLTLRDAMAYISGGAKPLASQIMSEIDYAMHFYRQPQPAMLIAYEREAYFDQELPSLRLTFDTNVRYRENDLQLEHGHEGTPLLPDDAILMEIKTDGAMPLWLARALSRCGILPTSFSKYGTAYQVTQGLIHSPRSVEAESHSSTFEILRGVSCHAKPV